MIFSQNRGGTTLPKDNLGGGKTTPEFVGATPPVSGNKGGPPREKTTTSLRGNGNTPKNTQTIIEPGGISHPPGGGRHKIISGVGTPRWVGEQTLSPTGGNQRDEHERESPTQEERGKARAATHKDEKQRDVTHETAIYTGQETPRGRTKKYRRGGTTAKIQTRREK